MWRIFQELNFQGLNQSSVSTQLNNGSESVILCALFVVVVVDHLCVKLKFRSHLK